MIKKILYIIFFTCFFFIILLFFKIIAKILRILINFVIFNNKIFENYFEIIFDIKNSFLIFIIKFVSIFFEFF